MKFNHVCISGNDFNCVLPDTISAGTGSDAICEWENDPSDADISESNEVIAIRLNGVADSSVHGIVVANGKLVYRQ